MSEKVNQSSSDTNRQAHFSESQANNKATASPESYTDQQLELMAQFWDDAKESETPIAALRSALTASGEFDFINQYKANNLELRRVAELARNTLDARKHKAQKAELDDILLAVSGKSTYADKRTALSEKLGFRTVYDMSNSEIDDLLRDTAQARRAMDNIQKTVDEPELDPKHEKSPIPDMSGLEHLTNVVVRRSDGSVDYEGWYVRSSQPEWDEKRGEWGVHVAKPNRGTRGGEFSKFVGVNQLRDWQKLGASEPEADPNQHAENDISKPDQENSGMPPSEGVTPDSPDNENGAGSQPEVENSPDEERARQTLLESPGFLLSIEHAVEDKMFNAFSGIIDAKEGVETGIIRLRQRRLAKREKALVNKLKKYEGLAQNSAFASRRSKFDTKARWVRRRLADARLTLDRLNTKHGQLAGSVAEEKKTNGKAGTEEKVRNDRHLGRLRKKEEQQAKEVENVMVARERRRRLLGKIGIGSASSEIMTIKEYREAVQSELKAQVNERVREAEQKASSVEQKGQGLFDRAQLNLSELRFKQSSRRLNKARSKAEKKVSLAQNRVQKAAQRYASNLTANDRSQGGDS
jgi:hypothetical protein